MAISNREKVKNFIGITTNKEDAFLDQLVPAVDAVIKHSLRRDIEQQVYTEYYNGNGTRVLVLNEYPVLTSAAVSVWWDDLGYWGQAPGSFDPVASLLTQGMDYAVVLDLANSKAAPKLYRINGVWQCRYETKRGMLTSALKPGAGNIKVTYTAGYPPGGIPQDLQMAFWQVCAQVRAARQAGMMMKEETFIDYSYTLEEMAKDALRVGSVPEILTHYRRLRERRTVLT